MVKSWTTGLSVEYYTRLERGAISGASPQVLESIARALCMANPLARVFYKDCYDMPGQPPNIARFTFLDDRSYEFYPDWDAFAEVTVSILRTEAGRAWRWRQNLD